MSEDIFLPKSSTNDALVGQLDTVTYVSSDKIGVERVFTQGYGLQSSGWITPDTTSRKFINDYFGFKDGILECCTFFKEGSGANIQIRTFYYPDNSDLIRQNYDGLIVGGSAISFPNANLHEHEASMSDLGFTSTMGVKEMEFKSSNGEIYTSAEIIYYAPDNVYLIGIKRPELFLPVGPSDPDSGFAAPAYSARCIDNAHIMLDFLRSVLGYEIRRDIVFPTGDDSAMLLPNDVNARFIQAFSPGSSTGYMVLMDHGKDNKPSPAANLGTPNRGIAMWSFKTHNLDEVYKRALAQRTEILHAPTNYHSLFLNSKRTLLMKDPGGFMIEVYEV